ncbi:MAG: hypothetical protein KGY38_00945 [Desulfobacterales bacterium]|nr:hypothetical protein [Desulfobacterales bacterium]
MKRRDIYRHLKEIAEKSEIRVIEQNLRATGVNARSGLCRLRGEQVFIMDKNLSINEKIQTLAACLKQMPLEDIYIMPAVRDIINRT